MTFDTLLKLYNDFTQVDSTKPIAVTFDKRYGVIFRQLGKVISIPYFRNYYFPSPKLKLGVLTPSGYNELMTNLKKLIEDTDVREGDIGMVIGSYKLSFYRCYSQLIESGPQLFSEINLVSIKKKWASKLYLKLSGNESRILLKAISNEERKRKSNKSVKDSPAT